MEGLASPILRRTCVPCSEALVLATAVLVLAVIGCGRQVDAAAPLTQPPELQLVDSVVLAETDSAYIGRPVAFTVDPHQGIYISDGFSSRIFNFTRAGTLRRIIGRRGTGPGELLQPSWMAVTKRGVLAVADVAQHSILLFDAASGAYRGMRRVDGKVTSIEAHGTSLLLGALNRTRHATSMTLDLADSNSAVRLFGPYPDAYTRAPKLTIIVPPIQRTAWRDSSLIAIGGIASLFLLDTTATVVDSFVVPRIHRRGLPPELLHRAETTRSNLDVARVTSMPYALARLASGKVGLVYFDPVIEGRRITGPLYLTVMSLEARRACADIPLPVSGDAQARVAFAGDTLFLLDQTVAGAGAVTTLRAYTLRDSACTWLPLQ